MAIMTSCSKKDTATPPVPNTGDLMTLPYTVSFENHFGTYTPYNVLGDQEWHVESIYSSAVMSGYADGSRFDNEDWLISSPVQIGNVEHAKAVMSYAAQYPAPSSTDVTMQVSTDYSAGNPNMATWTQLPTVIKNTASWDFEVMEFDLDAFINKTVHVAIKYTSTTEKARTIEIQSMSIQKGKATNGGGGTLTGDGTRENPFTANDVIILGSDDANTCYWVKDFIVGTIDSDNNYTYIYSTETTVQSNVIIASDVETTNDNDCVPVQLPYGAVREGVNLVSNPGNYKVEVLLYGTLEKYFSKSGVKNVTYAEINGNSYGVDPGIIPPSTVELPYNETFAATQGSFQIYDVTLGSGLNYVWKHNSQYQCMKGSGYYNSAHEAESWLVSPTIDLSSVSSAKMSFEHACNYETNPQEEMTLWVSTNFNGNIGTATWTQIPLSEYGTGFNFVNTGDIDLSAYVGGNIHVGFKYVSTNSKAATWEIRNFSVVE